MAAGAGGFAETCVGLSGSGSDASRADIMRHSPTGKVPALKDHALGVTVWDSLSICECVAEAFPEAQLWPADAAARAVSRSAAAEMHSGFGTSLLYYYTIILLNYYTATILLLHQ